jgi:hypothetical protein
MRSVLKKSGLTVKPDEFCALEKRGDHLRCVFLLDLGAEGVVP